MNQSNLLQGFNNSIDIQGLSKHLHSQHRNNQQNPNQSDIAKMLQTQQTLLNCLPAAFLQQRSLPSN
jgi:hypothetical protein